MFSSLVLFGGGKIISAWMTVVIVLLVAWLLKWFAAKIVKMAEGAFVKVGS